MLHREGILEFGAALEELDSGGFVRAGWKQGSFCWVGEVGDGEGHYR